MRFSTKRRLRLSVIAAAATLLTACAPDDGAPATAAQIRMYVLDGGVLASDPARYQLTEADVGTTELAIAAYLVVHPRGVLIWDTLAVADSERVSDQVGVEQRLVRADMDERFVQLGPRLDAQLASIGLTPDDVTHLALSHYHWDHTANANLFAGATWLVREVERNAMMSRPPPGGTRPQTFSELRNVSPVIVTEAEHDVFGDGTVVLVDAPGHTEGHQVLYVQLANTGGVVLSGDLYHYTAERTLGKVPTFEVDMARTAAARAEVEAFLVQMDAELWIGHDLPAHRRLRKAPEFYD